MLPHTVHTVDPYVANMPVATETVMAQCEFDFVDKYKPKYFKEDAEGGIHMTQEPGELTHFIGYFSVLKSGRHALKIHEFGDLEYGCKATGNVYNPYGSPHGETKKGITERRVGDIHMVQARFDWNAEYISRDQYANLSGPNSIIGRSLVIYQREDDFD